MSSLAMQARFWIAGLLAFLCIHSVGCTEGQHLDDDDTTSDAADDDEPNYGGFIEGPDSIDFEYVDVVTEETTQIRLRNKDTYPMQILAITVTGIEFGIFEVDHGAPAELPPQAIDIYFPIDLTFDPEEPGLHEAHLEIYSTDYRYEAGTPHVIPLQGTGVVDADGDGFWSDEHYLEIDADCDDTDPAVNPDATETCNGVDDDCVDGPMPDEIDFDFDGYMICEGDCEDSEPTVHPGAEEICDRFDTNCDGVLPIDELDSDVDGLTTCEGDCDDADGSLNWLDLDADGYATCEGDCDDADASLDSEDADADGYSTCDGDCDDSRPEVYPGAPEICDGLDDDCDGIVPGDELDADGDTYAECEGDCNDQDLTLNPMDADFDGYSSCDGDCDDADPSRYPTAPEQCNRVDDDCDGVVPAAEIDVDGDGLTVCEGDCDDGNPQVFPGAPEICDLLDSDCDGLIPSGEIDADGDGTPDCAGDCDDDDPVMNLLDEDGDGLSSCDGDCDDHDPLRRGGLPESCDGIDNDCDDFIPLDERDLDLDGFSPCEGDCDDDDASMNPSAQEVCGDGIDNDCNGHAVGCGIQGAVPLSAVQSKLSGEGEDDLAGSAVSPAGDFDGDGNPDLLIGAPGYAGGRGCTYVVLATVFGPLSLASSDLRLVGEVPLPANPEPQAGFSLAGGKDLDSDGISDFVIGAPRQEDGGAVYVIHGPLSGDHSVSVAEAKIAGSPGDDLGRSVVLAGDVDGDTIEDILIAAMGDNTQGPNAGAAHLFFGPIAGELTTADADASFLGEQSFQYAANHISAGEDLDGDGYSDILIGAGMTVSTGETHLFFGPVSGSHLLSASDATITGASNDDLAKVGCLAGDLDGDGSGDVIIGAVGSDAALPNAGAVFRMSLPIAGAVSLADVSDLVTGETTGDNAGIPIPAGDLTGDGWDDLLVSVCYESTGGGHSGAVYLVPGPLTGQSSLSSAWAKITGENASDLACQAAVVGDVDGDGFMDLLVGAPENDSTAANAGAAYLVFGGPGM